MILVVKTPCYYAGCRMMDANKKDPICGDMYAQRSTDQGGSAICWISQHSLASISVVTRRTQKLIMHALLLLGLTRQLFDQTRLFVGNPRAWCSVPGGGQWGRYNLILPATKVCLRRGLRTSRGERLNAEWLSKGGALNNSTRRIGLCWRANGPTFAATITNRDDCLIDTQPLPAA